MHFIVHSIGQMEIESDQIKWVISIPLHNWTRRIVIFQIESCLYMVKTRFEHRFLVRLKSKIALHAFRCTLAFIHVSVNCIHWHHATFWTIHIAVGYFFANPVTYNLLFYETFCANDVNVICAHPNALPSNYLGDVFLENCYNGEHFNPIFATKSHFLYLPLFNIYWKIHWT